MNDYQLTQVQNNNRFICAVSDHLIYFPTRPPLKRKRCRSSCQSISIKQQMNILQRMQLITR